MSSFLPTVISQLLYPFLENRSPKPVKRFLHIKSRRGNTIIVQYVYEEVLIFDILFEQTARIVSEEPMKHSFLIGAVSKILNFRHKSLFL